MSDAFYTQMAATALRLLQSYGKTVTLIRGYGDNKDPVTGVEVETDYEELETTGILKLYESSLIDGTRIKVTDRELVVSTEQAPTMADKVKINDVYWSILSVRPVNPAGVPVVYFLQVRS